MKNFIKIIGILAFIFVSVCFYLISPKFLDFESAEEKFRTCFNQPVPASVAQLEKKDKYKRSRYSPFRFKTDQKTLDNLVKSFQVLDKETAKSTVGNYIVSDDFIYYRKIDKVLIRNQMKRICVSLRWNQKENQVSVAYDYKDWGVEKPFHQIYH